MPRPRTNPGPKSRRKNKPPVQHVPAPPRWITTSGHSSLANGVITVLLATDIENVLTIGYSYQTPNERNALLGRPTFPRPHGPDYNFSNTIFLRQQEPGPSITHTFVIHPKVGCHNIYLAAFDGAEPRLSHSRSPIFALTYCATGSGGPIFQRNVTNNSPPNMPPPYWILLRLEDPLPGPTPPLSSPNCDIYLLDSQTGGQACWYNVSFPGCPIFECYDAQLSTYLCLSHANIPTFSRPWFGSAIGNVKTSPFPPYSTTTERGEYVCLTPGWTTSTQGGYSIAPNQACLSIWGGYGFGGWEGTDPPWPNDPWPYGVGPLPAPVIHDGSNNGDLVWQFSQVVFDYDSEVTFLADITKHWKSFPNPPDVEP